MLQYKSAESCRFDEVSLGEIMLRLDPGCGRIHTTRTFDVWEGGGEYNVARGLRRCMDVRRQRRGHRFGLIAGILTVIIAARRKAGGVFRDVQGHMKHWA